jgi:hypothetical protein
LSSLFLFFPLSPFCILSFPTFLLFQFHLFHLSLKGLLGLNTAATSHLHKQYHKLAVPMKIIYSTSNSKTSLVAWWSALLTTRHEVPGSIPSPAVGIFPNRGRSQWWPWSGYFVDFRLKAPPGTPCSYHHSNHRGNVTAPHGRPNHRSRLHFGHNQEGGPQSLYGHVVALEEKKSNSD